MEAGEHRAGQAGAQVRIWVRSRPTRGRETSAVDRTGRKVPFTAVGLCSRGCGI